MLQHHFLVKYVSIARALLKQGLRACKLAMTPAWVTGSELTAMDVDDPFGWDDWENAHSVPEMDSEIWGKLPHDLIVKVLAWLPPPYAVRMRSVCKSWNSLVFSQDDVSRATPHEPWILVCNYTSNCQTVCAFDPTLQKWYKGIPLIFQGLKASNIQVCTSAGGFLLCRSMEHVLYICNPLTRTWQKLPPCLTPMAGFTFEGFEMNMDIRTGSFKIYHDLCRYDESDQCDRMSELYDSVYASWKPFGSNAAHDGDLPEKIAFLKQDLYCVAFLAPANLRRYNMQKKVWSEIKLPSLAVPIYRIITVNLVECHDRLLLVAATLESGDCKKSLRVWELELSTPVKWIDLGIKPNQDCDKLLEMDFAKYSCVGRGDSFVVFSIKASEEGKALACDLNTKSWHWIDLCPGVEPLRLRDIIGSRRVIWGTPNTNFQQYLAYQPCLYRR